MSVTPPANPRPAPPAPPDEDARRYERVSLWLRLLTTAFSVAVLAAFLFSGASVALRDWARAVSANAWVVVVLYGLVAAVGYALLSLPIEYVTDHRRERRHGLSSQTAGAWLADQAKSFAIGLVFALVGLEVGYWLLRRAGDWWWLWAGCGMVLVSIALTSLGPVLFLPLFYKLRRIEDAALTERLTRVAEREGARVIGVYRMGMSAKTRRANAMVAGLGRTQRIILGDTLLDGFPPDEIEVVVAHEVAHYRHNDLWWGIVVGAVLSFGGLFLASLVLRALAAVGPLEGQADIAALPVLLFSLGVYGLLTLPLNNAYSRWRESRADAAALEATGLAGPFSAAMRRLAALNLANAAPHPLIEAIFYSHPAIARRIARAEEWSRVRRSNPAYGDSL
jgi:STE24 endopeptidase